MLTLGSLIEGDVINHNDYQTDGCMIRPSNVIVVWDKDTTVVLYGTEVKFVLTTDNES